MQKGKQNTRWVLGYDGDCRTCAFLAEELISSSDGRLTAQSLRSGDMRKWRGQALGEEAPWVPTLFSIDGTSVRAWTGTALVLKLGQLLGPRKMWQAVGLVGEFVDRSIEPESPGRRLVIQQGVAGAAASLALLVGYIAPVRLGGLTQLALAQVEEDEEEPLPVPKRGQGGQRNNRWEVRKLNGNSAKKLKDRAKDDKEFDKIRDNFARKQGWDATGSIAARVYFRGNKEREFFAQAFDFAGQKSFAWVVYNKEKGSKEWSRGYVVDGGELATEYFVKKDKLKSEEVRLQHVDLGEFQLDECDVNMVQCSVSVGTDCGLLGALGASLCLETAGVGCIAGAIAAGICAVSASYLIDFCHDTTSNCG